MERNSHLLYSEYMGTNEAAHALNLLEGKKEKPLMIYKKSAVLSRVMELLPRLKEAEEAMKGSESDMNIEVVKEGDPYIEVNVTRVEMDKLKDESEDELEDESEYESEEESEDESNSEPSEIPNSLASMNKLEPVLHPCIEVILISDNQQRASVSRTQESEITQEGQQNALVSEITQEDQHKLSKSEIMQEDPQSQSYNQAFPGASKRLKKLEIPTKHPDDYFAEIAKSDLYMLKVREKLLSKETIVGRTEKVRAIREQKKQGKKIQREIIEQRKQEKKKIIVL